MLISTRHMQDAVMNSERLPVLSDKRLIGTLRMAVTSGGMRR